MEKPAKVLHINCNYIGTTLHQLMIENLTDIGYENTVFCPTYNKDLAVIKPNPNVCVCECFKKWDRLIFDYKQRKIRKSLQQNINVSDFDLIHAYTLFTDGNCVEKLSEKYGIPYVVAVRNTDVNDFFRLMPHLRNRGIKIMKKASAVFFLSEAYKRQVFEKYVSAEDRKEIERKTYVIPNGIDEFWLKNVPKQAKTIDRKKINLIYAGRIDKNKNIPTIQKAMKILSEKGFESHLKVVGKVQDKKEFENIMKDNAVTYFPAMAKEKLIHEYRSSDIFVMPSFTESFGLVYAEAMSQGIPIIYSKGQGFDNQFPEGTVGYHVSPNDPSDVAGGIMKLAENYSEIQKNVVECSKEFSWRKLTEKYDGVYKKIKLGE